LSCTIRIWILLIAYVARYLTFESGQPPDPAAGSSFTGRSSPHLRSQLDSIFQGRVASLITPGLFAGWFLVFMPCLRELTVSILLWSAGNETVGVMVFNLQESGHTTSAPPLP